MLKSITFPVVIALYSLSVLCLLVAALSTFPEVMGSASTRTRPQLTLR